MLPKQQYNNHENKEIIGRLKTIKKNLKIAIEILQLNIIIESSI